MERDEEDLVRLYLTDIGQYPLLTKDDEVRLAQQIETGAAARVELEGSPELTPARKRELRKQVRRGRTPSARSCSPTCGWWSPSPRSTRRRASRSSI
ncbi:MAG: sigma-70 factor domain-containing protein [Acidimicrobiales bacterium]